MRSKYWLVVAVSAVAGAWSIVAAAVASGSARQAPAAVRAMCRHHHTFCSGYWTKLGGRAVYMIGTPMRLGVNGRSASVLGVHTLNNHGNNECMSSYGVPAGDNGGAPSDWNCNGSKNQQWDVYYQGLTYGTPHWGFINQGDAMCLNNRYGSTATDNIETLWSCDSTSIKQAYQFDSNHAILVFQSFLNGNDMCLTSLGYTLYGDNIYISSCNGSANQAWGNFS